MIKCTKNPENAVITHGGCFHADDVMATVILSKAFEFLRKDFLVCRVFKVPKNVKNQIVYDIGGGRFDHHQKGGNGVRINGVPYASCGLIWKVYGNMVIKTYLQKNGMPEESQTIYAIWKKIDKGLIQGIDAFDNGKFPLSDYPVQNMNISHIISTFNPNWDSEETSDEGFVKACDFAEIVLNNLLNKSISELKAREVVEEAIEKSHDHIMVLDKFAPCTNYILSSKNEKAKDIFFVIYPSNRIGYNWKCVPTTPHGSEYRKTVPKEWYGLEEKSLKKITGVDTAIFCNSFGKIGGALTLEDTIKLVKIAIDS